MVAGLVAGLLILGLASGNFIISVFMFLMSFKLPFPHTLCSPQRHPKLPVSLEDVQTEDLHSQPAGRDQRPLGSFLYPAIPKGL